MCHFPVTHLSIFIHIFNYSTTELCVIVIALNRIHFLFNGIGVTVSG